MSNIVKYGVRPETALEILSAVENSEKPVSRTYLSEYVNVSLMTVGKASEILVSYGALTVSRGENLEAGRKPGVLSPSGAVFLIADLSYGKNNMTFFSPAGRRIESIDLNTHDSVEDLFSELFSINEKYNVIGAGIICDSTDNDGTASSVIYPDTNLADIISSALKTNIYLAISIIDLLASRYIGKEDIIYLDSAAKLVPMSRYVNSSGVSRIGDISRILSSGSSDEEIGDMACIAAFICGAEKLVIRNGNNGLIDAAKKRSGGKVKIESDVELNIPGIADLLLRNNWLRKICSKIRYI